MLKSGFMNDFLGISQRIESIKATLPAAEPVEEHPDATTDYVQLAPGRVLIVAGGVYVCQVVSRRWPLSTKMWLFKKRLSGHCNLKM